MSISATQVHALLNPTAIAVVGARDDSPWAEGFVANLEGDGYKGTLYMVNPRRETAFGRPCYPSITAVPEKVDHACVLVAAERVPGVIEDCAAAGVRSATVIASGFDEIGGRGAELSRVVKALCDQHGIALIGPNCYGFNNYHGTYVSRYNIDVPALPGPIGLCFQSGQLGAATADAAYARGIRLGYVVSSGNELVLDTNDYLEYFLQNPEITVMGGVLERIPEPRRFERIARRALEVGKPIVVLKPGRSSIASRIAIAHTGSVTGSDAVVDTYLRDLGIIRVGSVEELAETAGLMARRGWPEGDRVAFCGFSGGAAELFAEEAEDTSLTLPQHSSARRARLSQVSTLPETAIHNPFDMTVDGAVHFAEIVETLAASGEYDIVVSQGQPRRSHVPDRALQHRAGSEQALMGAAERHGVFATFLDTGDHQPGIEVFEHQPSAGAYYLLGRNGVAALSNAIDYGRHRRAALSGTVVERVDAVAPDLRGKSGALDERDSKALLRAYGIATTEDIFVTGAEEAAAAADHIGYPVVLKVVAPEVPHKSDAGGVRLGLKDAGDVREAYAAMLRDVRAAAPAATIDGAIVSPQISGGIEFFAGISTDPVLGPVVAAGLGGIYVEVFKDVALARPHLSKARAVEMLTGLRAWPLLRGTRGAAALDVDAYAGVLCRLGQLAVDLEEHIVELDVNPLVVFPDGRGVIALDALVVLNKDTANQEAAS
jgi:acetyltransferase